MVRVTYKQYQQPSTNKNAQQPVNLFFSIVLSSRMKLLNVLNLFTFSLMTLSTIGGSSMSLPILVQYRTAIIWMLQWNKPSHSKKALVILLFTTEKGFRWFFLLWILQKSSSELPDTTGGVAVNDYVSEIDSDQCKISFMTWQDRAKIPWWR